MAASGLKTSRPTTAALWGLVGTLIVLGVHLVGLDDHAELDCLDLCFRYCSRLDSPDQIVHVDIDDGSLAELGRWPWPREILAGIVQTLGQCGAKSVALDILFHDPQEVRYVSAADDLYAEDADAELLARAQPIPVFDDALLTDAIETTGAAAAMYIDFESGVDHRLPSAQEAWLDRAKAALDRFTVPAENVTDFPLAAGPMVPPVVTVAEAAGLTGFVTIEPDADGVVRRIRLLGRGNGGVFLQFAVALAAADRLGSAQAAENVVAEDGEVRIETGSDPIRIPVDGEGRMLINWVAPGRDETEHIPASAVGFIWQQQQRLAANQRRIRLVQVQLVKLLEDGDSLALFARADGLFQDVVDRQRERFVSRLQDRPFDAAGLTAALKAQDDIEAALDRHMDELGRDLDEFYLVEPPEAPEDLVTFEQMKRYRDLWGQYAAANAQIRRDIDDHMARLRDRVAGKVCLIGSTATGAPDFVNTPTGSMIPGVYMHGAVFNTIVSGRFVRSAPVVLSLAVTMALGLAVSFISAHRPMLHAAVAVVGLGAAYVFINAYVVFASAGVHVPFVAPLGAAFVSFLMVAVYRQLTEERAKRHIRGMFAHALSPTLVDRLLEDPSLAELGGQKRRLTCMFSDLAGFTPLSHHLGPQQTVRVLNRYFDTMTDIVQNESGGFLNKFLGDGIFCFFGAPVLQDDHAARAIRASVSCQQQIGDLNRRLGEEFGQAVALAVRVGLATGEAMVGNCGSSQRMDYTAIGDCVNLAARLESANKDLHTQILVDDATWRAGDVRDVVARPVGRVGVRGVTVPVVVWHVWVAPPDEALIEASARFAEGVDLFQTCQFARAAEVFGVVADQLPGDSLTAIYLELCAYGQGWSAGQPWQPGCGDGDVIRFIEPSGSAITSV